MSGTGLEDSGHKVEDEEECRGEGVDLDCEEDEDEDCVTGEEEAEQHPGEDRNGRSGERRIVQTEVRTGRIERNKFTVW